MNHWLYYKVVQIRPGLICTNVHTNQSRSYLNHLVILEMAVVINFFTFFTLMLMLGIRLISDKSLTYGEGTGEINFHSGCTVVLSKTLS